MSLFERINGRRQRKVGEAYERERDRQKTLRARMSGAPSATPRRARPVPQAGLVAGQR
jgi:hypothetical protein